MDNENLFAFVLGRETELSLLELKAVLLRFGFGFCDSKNHPERAEDLSPANRTDAPCYTVLSVTDNIAIIKVGYDKLKVESRKFESEDLMKRIIEILGGTIKIFKFTKLSSSDLEKEICDLILSAKHGVNSKVDFGISDYSKGSFGINSLGLEIKKRLKPDLKSRFIFVKEGRELSSIVSESNKLDDKGIEVGIFSIAPLLHGSIVEGRVAGNSNNRTIEQSNNELYLGQLIALSDPFAWSKRDYGKPEGDKYSGMLPPKLARALINLALSPEMTKSDPPAGGLMSNKMPNESSSNNSKISNLSLDISNSDNAVVVDPFCGSGNIPIEAMMLGCGVIASDISEKAVHDTEANLDWIKSQILNSKSQINHNLINPNIQNELPTIEQSDNETIVFKADAAKDDFLAPLETSNHQLATIVTEPYLGEPKKFKPSKSAVLGEFVKLKDEYLGFLGNLSNLLETKHYKLATICLVFPLVESSDSGRISLWSESVDEIKKLGYTQLRPPLTYGRDYQIVKREIVFLQMSKS